MANCFCTGPDSTGKCRCQRNEEHNMFGRIKELESELFDHDNDYLSGWSKEKKIEWVRNNLKKS